MTPTQLALTGLQLRDKGIESLERHRWVDDARLAAEGILCQAIELWGYGEASSDDVHIVMENPPHENCYGAIFKDRRFASTGNWVQSNRRSAHGRWIRVWRLA